MNNFQKLLIGLLVVACTIPFLGQLFAAMWQLFLGAIGIFVILGLCTLIWYWIIIPVMIMIVGDDGTSGSKRAGLGEIHKPKGFRKKSKKPEDVIHL